MSYVGQLLRRILDHEYIAHTHSYVGNDVDPDLFIYVSNVRVEANPIMCKNCCYSLLCLGYKQISTSKAANLMCPCFIKNDRIDFCCKHTYFCSFECKQRRITTWGLLDLYPQQHVMVSKVRNCLVALMENFEYLELNEARIDEIMEKLRTTNYRDKPNWWIKI